MDQGIKFNGPVLSQTHPSTFATTMALVALVAKPSPTTATHRSKHHLITMVKARRLSHSLNNPNLSNDLPMPVLRVR
jgi:hypothetical protein